MFVKDVRVGIAFGSADVFSSALDSLATSDFGENDFALRVSSNALCDACSFLDMSSFVMGMIP